MPECANFGVHMKNWVRRQKLDCDDKNVPQVCLKPRDNRSHGQGNALRGIVWQRELMQKFFLSVSRHQQHRARL
eukprot:gene18711-biopygen5601